MTAGDYVHHSGYCITPVKGAACTFHNLYVVNVVRVNASQVILSAVVSVQTLAVNHYQDIVVAQSVQGHLASHVTCIEVESCA